MIAAKAVRRKQAERAAWRISPLGGGGGIGALEAADQLIVERLVPRLEEYHEQKQQWHSM